MDPAGPQAEHRLQGPQSEQFSKWALSEERLS